MGSMSALLDVSRSALNNAQAAINVTASNIANQTVTGYTRRVATFSTGDTVVIGGMPASTGASVAVRAQRDRVLDQRVLNATQAQASADARLSAMQNLDAIFTLDSHGNDSAGIGESLDSLFSSFRSLQADPLGAATRQGVLNAAQSFATAMNEAGRRLSAIQTSLQTQIGDTLQDVNATTAQVADLNNRIAVADSAAAESLQDQRQSALTHLSSLIGFNQISGDNGAINLSLADGTPLVTGGSAHTMAASSSSTGLRILTDKGLDVTNSISGGSIGGALTAYLSDVPGASSGLDQLAVSVATAVNTDNSAGITPQGGPGQAIFLISPVGGAATLSLATTDPNDVGAAALSEGSSGGSNAGAIAGLGNSAVVAGKTPAAYMAAFLTRLGGDIAVAQSNSTSATDSLAQATIQRDALSAVSLDEEAANLAQFQRSYQAAAKIFAVINDLLAASINLGSETTVA